VTPGTQETMDTCNTCPSRVSHVSQSPSHSVSLLSMDGCLTQSQHSIATTTSAKKKKGSMDKKAKSMSHDCKENKQTAQNISKRQKSNKTTSSSSKSAKSKSEAAKKSNNKSFESLLSTGAMSIDNMYTMDNESCANNDWEVSDLIEDSNNDLTDCPEGEGSNFPTLSKATLIDQDSGEVYQFIENKRGGTRETFLMQQHQQLAGSLGSPGAGSRIGSIGWSANEKVNNRTRHASRGDTISDFCNDLQLLIPDRDISGSSSGNVERFIAVPVSPSYLTDHLRSLQTNVHAASSVTSATLPQSQLAKMNEISEIATPPPQCTALVAAQVHAVSSDTKLPPPTSERLSPIGANSRATSKLSLDKILDENETKF